jgi:hypothetical protein
MISAATKFLLSTGTIVTTESSYILVEHFDITPFTNGTTHTLTNDVGDISTAFIRFPGSSRRGGGGPIGSTSDMGPDNAVAVQITDTNELTCYKGNYSQQKILGEVWRYIGPSNGANAFVIRGRYAIDLTGTSASQAVSNISNEDKCVPFLDGVVTTQSSTSQWEGATVAVHMDGSGNVVVSRNNSAMSVTVYVTVVEFTGSNWSVGHGVSSSHDSTVETVTLNTDSTGTGGSTFDVGNWDNAFIEATMGGDYLETGLSDTLVLVYPHSNTTQVYFDLVTADSNARNDANGYIHVIKNNNITVKRGYDANIPEGDNSYGTPPAWPTGASTTRNLDQLALEWYSDSSGTGTAHMRGNLTAQITDASGTISHWIHRAGNVIHVRYGVIDLSQLN